MQALCNLDEEKTMLELNCVLRLNCQKRDVSTKLSQQVVNLACRNFKEDVKKGINPIDLVYQKRSSCVENWVGLL